MEEVQKEEMMIIMMLTIIIIIIMDNGTGTIQTTPSNRQVLKKKKLHSLALFVKFTLTRSLLQRVSIACCAERCISYDKFRPYIVSDTVVSCQNYSSYDHAVFTGG